MFRRRRVLALSLLFFFFIVPAGRASGAQGSGEEFFITGLVMNVEDYKFSGADRERVIETARALADLSGDRGGLSKKVEELIKGLPDVSEETATGLNPDELYKDMTERHRRTSKVRAEIEDFIMGFLDKAFDLKSTKSAKEKSINTALELSKIYGEIWRDNLTFHRRLKQIVSTFPKGEIKNDADIVEEFMQAKQHDNVYVMNYLVGLVHERIEPFVEGLIKRALDPETSKSKKDELLQAAMNFAKRYGNIIGEHSLHRKIHRQTFTARLTEQVVSKGRDGIHIVDTPLVARLSGINIFSPDNIVISVGESVSWINNDVKTHVIGTFDFLSDGHFFAPNVGPGATFSHTFTQPGAYYYICYIHESMIGKIVVEEKAVK